MVKQNQFREFRRLIGFTQQAAAKDFLQGRDVSPELDLLYLKKLNQRLEEIAKTYNSVMDRSVRQEDMQRFLNDRLHEPYRLILEFNHISKMNNNGRRMEDVYFNWMRGFLLSHLFAPVVAAIFEVSTNEVRSSGDDDFTSASTFVKSPKADFEVIKNQMVRARIEMQMGFSGSNDIKRHKIEEAIKVFNLERIPSIVFHIDLFNGVAAVVPISSISIDDVKWQTRAQFEGKEVLEIPEQWFQWSITDIPPKYDELRWEL